MNNTIIPTKIDLIIAIFVSILYILLGKISIFYTTMPEGISIVWLPNAILLSLFLIQPKPKWIFYIPFIICAEIIADYPTFTIIQAIQFALINLAETIIIAFLIHKFNKSTINFNNTQYVLLYIIIALIAIPSLSAIFGALVYITQISSDKIFIEFWRIWFFGDSLGLLLLVPFIVLSVKSKLENWLKANNIEAYAINIFTIFISFVMFSNEFITSILPATPIVFILLLLWIVYRQGILLGLLMGIIVSFIATYFTIQGTGPFSIFNITQNTIYLQEFISALMTITLFFGVLLKQIEDNALLLKESNEALQTLTLELDEKVKEKTKSLEEANIKLTQMATTDYLTKIYNRRFFEEFATKSIKEALRHKKPLSLITFDIDKFKVINDTFGHKAGDDILINVAKTISSVLREYDIFARIGGEEFVILMPNTSAQQASIVAEKLRILIEQSKTHSGNSYIKCTISLGVSELNSDLNTVTKLLNNADTKLYQAKETGRNKVIV